MKSAMTIVKAGRGRGIEQHLRVGEYVCEFMYKSFACIMSSQLLLMSLPGDVSHGLLAGLAQYEPVPERGPAI